MGREGNPDKADTNASDFMWYDRYIQQTVPFIVNAQFSGGISETQLVCVAPNEVVEGGRVPAQISAASINRWDSGWIAIYVALTVSIVAIAT